MSTATEPSAKEVWEHWKKLRKKGHPYPWCDRKTAEHFGIAEWKIDNMLTEARREAKREAQRKFSREKAATLAAKRRKLPANCERCGMFELLVNRERKQVCRECAAEMAGTKKPDPTLDEIYTHAAELRAKRPVPEDKQKRVVIDEPVRLGFL